MLPDTGLPVLTGPDRIHERELEQRHQQPVEQVDAEQRQQRVEHAVEQVLPHPPDDADRGGRRRQVGDDIGADIGALR